MGRGGLGDKGRAREDRLVAGAVHGGLPRAQHGRVHVGRRRVLESEQSVHVAAGSRLREPAEAQVGAEELHGVQLLHGCEEVSAGATP